MNNFFAPTLSANLRLAGLVLPMILLVACGGRNTYSDVSNPTTPAPTITPPPTAELPDFITLADSPTYVVDPETARSIFMDSRIPTGSTAARIYATANTILDGSDTVYATPVGLPDPTCADGRCFFPGTTIFLDVAHPPFSNFQGSTFNAQPVMIQNGVETIEAYTSGVDGTLAERTHQTYAGWLDGSIFGTETVSYAGDTFSVGYSAGNDSGSNPTGTGSATWNGLVIAGSSSNLEHRIQGDATIDIDNLANPDVDVLFSNIRNLVLDSTMPDMNWDDIPVTDGKFSSTTNGDIEGTFYGPNHQEVGGVFDNGTIFGGFGATRQSQ